jgi:hypothetical protein
MPKVISRPFARGRDHQVLVAGEQHHAPPVVEDHLRGAAVPDRVPIVRYEGCVEVCQPALYDRRCGHVWRFEWAAVTRPHLHGLPEVDAAGDAEVIDAVPRVGGEIAQRLLRFHDHSRIGEHRSPAEPAMIPHAKARRQERRQTVPIALRDRVQPAEISRGPFRRRQARDPARVEHGPSGVDVVRVEAIVRDDVAALVRLDQEERVDGARANCILGHLHDEAREREALSTRREKLQRPTHGDVQRRARKGEELLAIEVEVEQAPMVQVAAQARLGGRKALGVAPSPGRDGYGGPSPKLTLRAW